jgi:hypothetical protein
MSLNVKTFPLIYLKIQNQLLWLVGINSLGVSHVWYLYATTTQYDDDDDDDDDVL